MKYETFYDLFANAGFKYVTTKGNGDIYQRGNNEYNFCFVCGHIIKNGGDVRKFMRGISECKQFLNQYFNEEKKNQTANS